MCLLPATETSGKIDRNTAKNLKDCQDGKTELTDAYENLLEKFKKNQSVHQSVSEDYEESVENRVAIALTENPQNEIAVLALADYEDETISIDEIYCILSEGQTDLAAKINMEDQMKLIKYCEKNNKIPVVIHSHLYAEKEVSFSTIDLNFEHEFHHVQEILNYSVNSVFIVYGKTQSYARLCLKNKSMPFLMEDQINCITYREGSI